MHPWAKMRRNVNLTQAEVGMRLGVERLSIIRYEQGMFGHLSDPLLESLSRIYGVDKALLIQEYRGFQRVTRQEFKVKHRSWAVVLNEYQGLKHPLIHYRTYYELSRNGLCKALCLDYGPVAAYERNKQRSIPETLKTASEDIYWDYTGLESAVLEWRASGRSGIKR